MVFIQEYRCVPNFAFSGTYLAKRVPDLPFWGTYQKDLFLHIKQEQKHILCNIAESNRASLHNPNRALENSFIYDQLVFNQFFLWRATQKLFYRPTP